MLRRGTRPWTWAVCCALAIGLGMANACFIQKDGERSATGVCPEGEKCSDKTPDGLRFVGLGFFDSERPQLGPILEGGDFQVGLWAGDDVAVPAFVAVSEDDSVLTGAVGTGVFGPTWDDGTSVFEHVERHMNVSALRAGTTRLRVLDAENGDLFDRVTLDVYRLAEVEVVNVSERDFLYAGCDEMVGVHLYAESADGAERFRAFDQGVSLSASVGEVAVEPRFWDCIGYEVPRGADEIAFEVRTGGQTYERRLPVRTLAQDGLEVCPPRPID